MKREGAAVTCDGRLFHGRAGLRRLNPEVSRMEWEGKEKDRQGEWPA